MPEIKPLTLEEVRDHIEKTLSEIVVVVEAIDPQLSGTFQSLQSYKYEDIVFGEDFGACMSTDYERNVFEVNMKKFHHTRTRTGPRGGSIAIGGCSPKNSGNGTVSRKSSVLSAVEEDEDEFDIDELADDAFLENGGNYFRRSYSTFQSSRLAMGAIFKTRDDKSFSTLGDDSCSNSMDFSQQLSQVETTHSTNDEGKISIV